YSSLQNPRIDIQLPLNISFDARARCTFTQLTYAMLQVDELTRPTAQDVLGALLWNVYWDRSFVWISECCHFVGEVIDVLAPRSNDSVWSTVIWSRYEYSVLWFGECTDKMSSEGNVNPLRV